MRFYVGTGLDNFERARELQKILTEAGHTITYDWTQHGSVQNLPEEERREIAQNEIEGIESADHVVLLLPGYRGTHTELGIAIGTFGSFEGPKSITIWGESEEAFLVNGKTCAFYHASCVTKVVDSWENFSAQYPGLF